MNFYKNNSRATQRGGAFFIRFLWAMVAMILLCSVTMTVCVVYAYPAEEYPAEEYSAEEYSAEEYSVEEYSAGEYPIDEYQEDFLAIAEEDVVATDTTLTVKKKITHIHTGNEENGGGCYTVPHTEYIQEEVRCSGTLHYWGEDWDTSECTVCGASYNGNRGGESCPHTSMETRQVTRYSVGCGKSGATLGYVTYNIYPTDWTKEVVIDVEIENIGMKLGSKPYRFDGDSYENGHFTVNANGRYSLGISADANTNTAMANYTAVITNIDVTGPTLKSYTVIPNDWTRDGVDVILDEIADLQPDGTEGCGIADSPFSFDAGATYTSLGSGHYTENGTYEFLIVDRLGNTKTNTITIGNVDNEAPNITAIEYDDSPNQKNVEMKISCNDRMKNGLEGCGLAEEPYSFDGGKTWVKDSTIMVDTNRTISFKVRDRLGNTNSQSIVIDNLDDEGPSVAHKMTPDSWTNQNVKVTFSAKDINGKGENGVGLPKLCYSYDGGRSWTDSPLVEVVENRPVHVTVRDINDNYTYYSMEVGIIDRIPPTARLHYEYDDDGTSARLVAEVSDNLSGVDITSTRWTGQGKKSGTNELVVDATGKYDFVAYDRAGNGTEGSVNVEEFPRNSPNPGDGGTEEEQPIVPTVPDVPEVIIPQTVPVPSDDSPKTTSTKRVQDGDEAEALSEEATEEKEEVIVFPKIEKSTGTEMQDSAITDDEGGIRGWWKGLSALQRTLLLLLLLLLLILLLLLLFLYERSVVVLCDRTDSTKGEPRRNMLGIKLINLKKGHYFVIIDDKMWNRAESTHFLFRFGLIFRMLHSGEDIYINFPGEQVRLSTIGSKTNVTV